jgi:hypothetical protein
MPGTPDYRTLEIAKKPRKSAGLRQFGQPAIIVILEPSERPSGTPVIAGRKVTGVWGEWGKEGCSDAPKTVHFRCENDALPVHRQNLRQNRRRRLELLTIGRFQPASSQWPESNSLFRGARFAKNGQTGHFWAPNSLFWNPNPVKKSPLPFPGSAASRLPGQPRWRLAALLALAPVLALGQPLGAAILSFERPDQLSDFVPAARLQAATRSRGGSTLS